MYQKRVPRPAKAHSPLAQRVVAPTQSQPDSGAGKDAVWHDEGNRQQSPLNNATVDSTNKSHNESINNHNSSFTDNDNSNSTVGLNSIDRKPNNGAQEPRGSTGGKAAADRHGSTGGGSPHMRPETDTSRNARSFRLSPRVRQAAAASSRSPKNAAMKQQAIPGQDHNHGHDSYYSSGTQPRSRDSATHSSGFRQDAHASIGGTDPHGEERSLDTKSTWVHVDADIQTIMWDAGGGQMEVPALSEATNGHNGAGHQLDADTNLRPMTNEHQLDTTSEFFYAPPTAFGTFDQRPLHPVVALNSPAFVDNSRGNPLQVEWDRVVCRRSAQFSRVLMPFAVLSGDPPKTRLICHFVFETKHGRYSVGPIRILRRLANA